MPEVEASVVEVSRWFREVVASAVEVERVYSESELVDLAMLCI